jgi:hypothetical protein
MLHRIRTHHNLHRALICCSRSVASHSQHAAAGELPCGHRQQACMQHAQAALQRYAGCVTHTAGSNGS